MKRLFFLSTLLLLLCAPGRAQEESTEARAERANERFKASTAARSADLAVVQFFSKLSVFFPVASDPVACGASYKGIAYFNTVSNVVKLCNGTSWLSVATGTGLTNSASANVITKSDGTNLVASQITDNGTTATVANNLTINGQTTIFNADVSGSIDGTQAGFDLISASTNLTATEIETATFVRPLAAVVGNANTTIGDSTHPWYAGYFSNSLSVGLGATAAPTRFVVGDTSSSTPRGLMSWQASSDTSSAHLHMRKSRGTFASPTTIVTGDFLGRVVFSGYDGSAYNESAYIRGTSTGTIGSTRIPSKLEFFTSTDAAPSVATLAFTLNADQTATFAKGVTISSGSFVLTGATSGTTTIQAPAIAGSATVTMPNASSTLPIYGAQITYTGPTAARTVTYPDASFTVARTDAANTFSGAQTFSSTINKLTLTAPASGATFTLADGKTITISNTLTFTGTDSSSVAFGGGGTVLYTSNNASALASTTSSQMRTLISDETGTGSAVFATSPSLVTPSLGAATATSINIGTGTTILKHLSNTATLDFANLAAIGCEDLTITVTGAALGDTVAIGVPNAAIVTNGTFFGWVSATNTVSIKFCTVVSGDPASGTFRADVTQH